MVIRFYGPFRELAGDQITVDLRGENTLRDLLCILSQRIEGLLPFSGTINDTDLSAHVMFIRKGRFLRLNHQLDNSDTIDVVLPATGG